MYMWRLKTLKAELRDGPLPPRRLLPYLLGFGLLMAIVPQILVFVPLSGPNQWDVLNAVGTVVVTILGALAVYHANGGPDGSDLAGRLLALSWVVGWRLSPMLLLLVLASAIFVADPSTTEVEPSTFGTVIGGLGYQALFYWRLSKHLRDLAKPRLDASATPAVAV